MGFGDERNDGGARVVFTIHNEKQRRDLIETVKSMTAQEKLELRRALGVDK